MSIVGASINGEFSNVIDQKIENLRRVIRELKQLKDDAVILAPDDEIFIELRAGTSKDIQQKWHKMAQWLFLGRTVIVLCEKRKPKSVKIKRRNQKA
jgi:hypothetical protein